jgi:hypothetical protein
MTADKITQTPEFDQDQSDFRGRLRGLELYLAGDESGPNDESLARAVRAFAAVAQIEKQGRDLIRPRLLDGPRPGLDDSDCEVDLEWIDCQRPESVAVFTWIGDVYMLWLATLNENCEIVGLEMTNW